MSSTYRRAMFQINTKPSSCTTLTGRLNVAHHQSSLMVTKQTVKKTLGQLGLYSHKSINSPAALTLTGYVASHKDSTPSTSRSARKTPETHRWPVCCLNTGWQKHQVWLSTQANCNLCRKLQPQIAPLGKGALHHRCCQWSNRPGNAREGKGSVCKIKCLAELHVSTVFQAKVKGLKQEGNCNSLKGFRGLN